ncbi:MAG TPA: ATP-binding protein [Gemmatimonadaceae bacterium]|nr:ATP-binding protein [Gemmatimonadaceae bacterium]
MYTCREAGPPNQDAPLTKKILSPLLDAPPAPVARARWLFLLGSLTSAIVGAGILASVSVSATRRYAAAAAILALVLHWYRGYQRQRFPNAAVVVDGLLLATISAASGEPFRMLGLFYGGLNFRALYGSKRDTAMLFLAYTVAFNAGLMIVVPPERWGRLPGALLPQLVSFALSALVLYALAQALERQERMADVLRQGEQRYHVLFESNPSPMWVFETATRRITDVNQAALERYGYTREEFLALTLADIRPPEDVPQLETALADVSVVAGTTHLARHRKKDGTIMDVEVTGRPLGDPMPGMRIVLATDVTDRLAAERLALQLRQAQKMEAVGQLAGGVAHDFNNLLTSIKCSTTFLLDDMEPADPRCTDVLEIDSAVTRAATLTRQLLAFSRKQVLQPVVLDSNALITDLERMLRRLVPENIRQSLQLHPESCFVKADVGQLEQVIINLVVNARDAMPHGGALTISTTCVELTDDPECWHHESRVKPGEYVVISVSDTGCGMDRETQERIFEPFFTTKPTGHGTGLGLSTVYGIITQSNGYLWVYSELGEGSTFRIYLPRVNRPAASTATVREPSARTRPRGSERILIVEDDAAIRSAVSRMLVSQGYTVLTAANAEDALTVSDQRGGALDLVLTDVVMPGISGPALVERLSARGRPVRALFMSGYPRSHITQREALEQGVELLEKPFTPAQLATRVRAVLDREAAGSGL